MNFLDLPLPLIFLFLILAVAIATDVRTRKIPNWLVLTGLVGVIALHYYDGGWSTAQDGLKGAAFAFLATAPLVFFKIFGAGDSKLLLTVGAAVPFADFFLILCFAFMLSGVMGLLGAVLTKQMKTFGANVNIGIISALNFNWSLTKSVAEHSAYRVPFALPLTVSVGIWLYWFY